MSVGNIERKSKVAGPASMQTKEKTADKKE